MKIDSFVDERPIGTIAAASGAGCRTSLLKPKRGGQSGDVFRRICLRAARDAVSAKNYLPIEYDRKQQLERKNKS
ncbi:MAG: hypothetical protein WBE72_22460 [Terracidiphilus sp.]